MADLIQASNSVAEKVLLLLILLACRSALLLGDGLIPPLTQAQTEQARKILSQFKTNPKGPYLQIRWFCKDGSVYPPQGTPCKAHGGGIQYAELSPSARQLAKWNLDTGVILASLDFQKFLDAERGHFLLRELVLEKYLVEVDNGWIYRRAATYRGARQAEDEEKAGRQLIEALLGDPEWVRRNYFLLTQLITVIPHGIPDSATLKIRALAASIADEMPAFQPVRAKIHSQPSSADLATVEKFVAEQKSVDTEKLTELADLLRQQYMDSAAVQQAQALEKRLARTPLAKSISQYVAALRENRESNLGASLSTEILRQVTAPGDVRHKLDLLDLNALILDRAFQSDHGETKTLTRRQQLNGLLEPIRFATGAGLLSARQYEALRSEIESLDREKEVSAARYHQAVHYLERSAGWCRATVAQNFGPVARHYQEVEPEAVHLVDHLLRGSIALRLTARLERLVLDANRVVGIRHFLLGSLLAMASWA